MMISSNDVNFLQGGTGAVTRTVQDRLRETVSVKDFGATGNGTTDDYAAIDKALAYLKASSPVPVSGDEFFVPNRTLYFPPGTYYCSATINLKQQVRLLGETRGNGAGSATTLLFPPNKHGIIVNRHNTDGEVGSTTSTTSAEGSVIESLRVASGSGSSSTSSATGIYARARVLIERCTVEYFARDGIALVANEGGTYLGNCNNSVVSNCTVAHNGRHGLYIFGDNANDCVISNLNTFANGGYGFADSTTIGQSWIGGHSASNGQLDSGLFPTTSIVWHQGALYAVMPGQGQAASTTVPGTNPNVWTLVESGVPSAFPNIPAWTSGMATCEGGAAFIGIGRHVHLNPYTEGRQGPYYNNGALTLGGLAGAGYRGNGASIRSDSADNVLVTDKAIRVFGPAGQVDIGSTVGAVARYDPVAGFAVPVGAFVPRDAGQPMNYTLGGNDIQRVTRFTNSSTCTVKVPPNHEVPFAVGTEIILSAQGSAGVGLDMGQVNRAGKQGSTIPAGGTAHLYKQGSNTWLLRGDVV